MTPDEFDLRSFLDEEASRVDAPGDFPAAVFARKRRSDKRRAVTAGVAVAAALAVAIPLAWNNLGGPQRAQPARPTGSSSVSTSAPSPTSSGARTPSRTTAATTIPSPVVTATANIEDAAVTGAPTLGPKGEEIDPGVPYAVSGVIRDGSAPEVKVSPDAGFSTFARLAGGGYVYEAQQTVVVVQPSGRSAVLKGAAGYVVSTDRTRIVWTDAKATDPDRPGQHVIHIADTSGKEVSTVKADAAPVALDGDTLYAVELNGFDYGDTSLRIDLTTGRRTTIQGSLAAFNAATGLGIMRDLGAGQDPESTKPSCYQVVDVRSTEPVVRLTSCGTAQAVEFSPDGRYVFSYADIVVVSDARTGRVVLDATGRSGLHTTSARMTDDNGAVVMTVSSADHSRAGLVRCELTGACTQVGPSLPITSSSDLSAPPVPHAVSTN